MLVRHFFVFERCIIIRKNRTIKFSVSIPVISFLFLEKEFQYWTTHLQRGLTVPGIYSLFVFSITHLVWM